MQDSTPTVRFQTRPVGLTALICLSLFMVSVMSPSLLFAKKGKGGGNGGGNPAPVVVPQPAPAPAPTPVVDPVPPPPPPGPAPFVPSALTGPNFGDVTLPPAERPQALSLWNTAPSGLSNIPPTLVLMDLNSGEFLNLGHHGFDVPQSLVLMNDRLLVGGVGPVGADLQINGELWDFTQLPGSLVSSLPHPAPGLAVDPISGNLFNSICEGTFRSRRCFRLSTPSRPQQPSWARARPERVVASPSIRLVQLTVWDSCFLCHRLLTQHKIPSFV